MYLLVHVPVRLRGRLRKGSGDAVATVNKVTADIYIYICIYIYILIHVPGRMRALSRGLRGLDFEVLSKDHLDFRVGN